MSFITCAEYQLFLDEMYSLNRYYQPEHWTELVFEKGQAEQPITGVNFNDAQMFCDWLSKRHGKNYRLPTNQEIENFSLTSKSEIGCWGIDGELYGLPQRFETKLKTKLADMSSLPAIYFNLSLEEERNFTVTNLIPNYNFKLDINLLNNRNLNLKRSTKRIVKENLPEIDFNLELACELHPKLAYQLHKHLNELLSDNEETQHSLDRALDRALNLAIALAKPLTNAFQVRSLIKNQDLTAVNRLISTSKSDTSLSLAQQKQIILLESALNIARSQTFLEWRYAFREFLLYLLEQAYNENPLPIIPWWQFWKKYKEKNIRKKLLYLQLYWNLKIIKSREEKNFPAWESIQIVREAV